MTGTTIADWNGLYKEVYGRDGFNNIVPNSAVVYKLIDFEEGERVGNAYHEVIYLTNEHGMTYIGSTDSIATLNTAVTSVSKDASITPFEFVGQAQMSYGAASRAAEAGKRAFKRAMDVMLKNLRESAMKRIEHSLLYGQSGLGAVETLVSHVITITAATWNPTIWAGLEGALLDVFTDTTTGASQHDASGLTISSVNFDARQITVTGDSTTTTGDVLYFRGARTTTVFKECAGIYKISGNTGSLFGIDAASYSLWKGNQKTSFGTPTMGRFLDALVPAIDKGLDEGAMLLVSPKTYEVLNADLMTNRFFDSSYSKGKSEAGASSINYYGQAGQVEVVVSPFLRIGDAVAFPKSVLKRIGSTDLGLLVPGTNNQDVFYHDPTTSSVVTRAFSDQALFCTAPCKLVQVSGITYT